MRVPIPEPIALCEDNSVIGTPFYIMEFLYGRIFEDSRLPEVTPSERRELWVYFLLKIHLSDQPFA
jgi:aminoglycoside phosphotransferase (APT) family kinase protein